MKATKYKFIKEIIIPKEDKYNLSEIINYITDIYDRVHNPFTTIEKSYYDIGNDLINNTGFYNYYTPNQIEITVPIKDYTKDNSVLYTFQLRFKIFVEKEEEFTIIKVEYKRRIEKWMYEKICNYKFEEKEVEV